MESSSLSSIESLVATIKREILSDEVDIYSFVSKSAYDTAWLAMIPNPQELGSPMFKGCLEWVLDNQKEEGYWGESKGDGVPTIDTLPATLVCMVALKKWHVGTKSIEKGMEFIHTNMVALLKEYDHGIPRWFALVFPAAVELAQANGLEFAFHNDQKAAFSAIYNTRQQILEREELVDECQYPPLLAFLETFPSTYDHIDEEIILKHLHEDGSLFRSPSATASAFMATGNRKCLNYLKSLVRKCPNGVPALYPMDEGLVKLSMVDQIQKLGLFEYFSEDIEKILAKVHRSYMYQESQPEKVDFVPAKRIYKDSIAFRLLRLHGYNISTGMLCWFLDDEEIMDHLVQNCEHYTTLLYTMYRATDVIFSGERELDETREFSRTLLNKVMPLKNRYDNLVEFSNLHEVIEHELNLPWIARLDHLDHRMWIEQSKESPLWIEKASFYRLSCVHNEKLLQLAVENYKLRQLTYMSELEDLKRWTKKWGLSEMGFGRERTVYCYYAIAASTSLPHDSIVRMMVAKSAILITVADDFYDMRGSLQELQRLTEAIQRWDGKGLTGTGKVIFDVLDDFVGDVAAEYLNEGGSDITDNLRDIWRETFGSWLMEATWGMTGYAPSTEEYLQTGMTSIGTHTLVLPSLCLLNPSLPSEKLLKPQQYESVTKLLMATARLLNDIQSYQKEQEEGTMNLVLLNMKENPKATIEDSISYTKNLLVEKRKELLKHIMTDDYSDLPKSCKQLHLGCLKTFQMFFHSSNRFDSNTGLLEDIKKAIYIPPKCLPPKVTKTQPLPLPLPSLVMKEGFRVNGGSKSGHRQLNGQRSVIAQKWLPMTTSKYSQEKVSSAPKFKLSLIRTKVFAV